MARPKKEDTKTTKKTTRKATTTKKVAPKKTKKIDPIQKAELESIDSYNEDVEKINNRVQTRKLQTLEDIEKKKLLNRKVTLGLLIALVVIIIIIIIVLMLTRQNDKDTGIDRNLATYNGKEIYKDKDGNTVIVEENDSKTIESKKTDSGYHQADDDTSNKYEISDVNLSLEGGTTKITGKVKNNGSNYTKVYVNIKFYADGKVVGSASCLVTNLKKKKQDNFEIKILGDFRAYEYKVKVEYVG